MAQNTPAYSRTIMTELVLPNDTNALHNLRGGKILHWMDICSAIAAGKHAKAVVVTGLQDKNAQLLALAINQAINSEVIDVVKTKQTRKGNDAAVAQLIADMNAGKVGAVIINNANPVYTLPNATEFVEGLKKVKLYKQLKPLLKL